MKILIKKKVFMQKKLYLVIMEQLNHYQLQIINLIILEQMIKELFVVFQFESQMQMVLLKEVGQLSNLRSPIFCMKRLLEALLHHLLRFLYSLSLDFEVEVLFIYTQDMTLCTSPLHRTVQLQANKSSNAFGLYEEKNYEN